MRFWRGYTMMNIVALAMLLSSLGSAMLLSPEPMIVRSPEDGESPLQAIKEAAQGTYDTAEHAKDTIVEGVTRPLEKGLGWFRRKPPTPEDRLAAAREKAAEAREAFEEASAQLRDAAVGKAVDTGMYVGDKSSQAVGAAKDAAGSAEGWVEKGAHSAYNKAADIKDGAYNAAAAVGHKVGSAFQTAKDSAEDTYDSAAETLGSAKDKAHDKAVDAKGKVVDAKDKVKEGAENVHDAVVDDVHLGVDKSKGTAIDAAEKVEQAAHETKETGQGILGKVKDAACYTAECIRARAQEAGSYLPNIGQGVGFVHKDAPAESVKDKAAETARNAKDTAGEYYEDARDWAEDRYDSAREYYDDAGRRYRRAREYYHDAPSDYYRGRRGRNAASRYYDATKDEAEDFYDHGVKDRARYLRDRAGDYYDDVRGYLPGGRSRDYSYGRRGRDWGEDYYRRSRMDDLNEVVESMGWKRVGKVPRDHVSVSSPKEVVIGDVKYAWPKGKGQPPSDELHETVFHHMTNSVKGAAHTVGEKLGFVKEKAKDTGARAKDQAYRSWAEQEGDDDDDEEDSIVTRGAKNLKEGVRNAGQAYEEQRSKAGEYADEARQELSNFAGYREEDDKGSDHRRRSWKDVLIRKPVGFLLTLTRALHLFTFSTVYGSSFWVTFVSGLILSKHVPRQQFGYVQSRMFPVYYRIMAVGQTVLLVLHSLLHPWFSAEGVERTQLLNFALMIASTLINAYYLEPKATKVMFERLKVEKEEGRGLENTANPLDAKQVMEDQKKKLNNINEQFKTLHGYSSAVNLISLGGLTCHLWHLANRLVI